MSFFSRFDFFFHSDLAKILDIHTINLCTKRMCVGLVIEITMSGRSTYE